MINEDKTYKNMLNEMRSYKRTNKNMRDVMNECALLFETMAYSMILEGVGNSEETQDVLTKIQNDDFEVDNYEKFCAELGGNKRSCFLTQYTPDELRDMDVRTYQVAGYPIGFAIKEDGDIVGVHNNSNAGGIGQALIKAAIDKGGTKLDHYAGFLDGFYGGLGFEEYDRCKWNDMYAPENWEYDTYGTPDVVFRQLKKTDI